MDYLNNSKIIAGVAMLMLNVGSKYVQLDLGRLHELILSNEYVKKLIVFCMFFVATRDIGIAFLLTILYIIIIDCMLNDRKKFCIVSKSVIDNKITDVQYEKAQEIIHQYQQKKQDILSPSDIYENYTNILSHI